MAITLGRDHRGETIIPWFGVQAMHNVIVVYNLYIALANDIRVYDKLSILAAVINLVRRHHRCRRGTRSRRRTRGGRTLEWMGLMARERE